MNFGLNKEQTEALNAPIGPLLIVAGAGTGKTRTLMSRLLDLISRGERPDSICAITFTNKAAREMQNRLENFELRIEPKAAPDHKSRPFIGTFHSLGSRILRERARILGRTAGFVIFDGSDTFSLIKKILKRLQIEDPRLKPSHFAQIISKIKSGSAALDDLLKSRREEGAKVAAVLEEYERDLEKTNAFDFDDLIQKTVFILDNYPQILAAYHAHFKHILVDEYQDVNKNQYELLRLLAKKSASITAVGDDHQTIYSWRGSDVEFFLGFEREWPGSRVVLLTQNYRSTKTIIAAASTLIQNNKRQKQKILWTENQEGIPIRIIETASEEEEADWIADQIEATKKIQKIKNEDSAQPSVAVLYRTNAQSRAIEQALIARGLEYQVFGGLKFYERREIKDIVAALRYIYNRNDEISRDRLEKISKTRFRRFVEFAESLKENAEPLEIIRMFLDRADYFGWIDAHLTNIEERRENIAEFLYFAGQFKDTSVFLEQIALMQSTDTVAKSKEGIARKQLTQSSKNSILGIQNPVQLMTIHLAKGLEFDHVYLAGCREDIMPHAFSLETEGELEEERRLMYVAMTRAKSRLAIAYHDIPSRFLFEIPQSLTKFESLTGAERLEADEQDYITID